MVFGQFVGFERWVFKNQLESFFLLLRSPDFIFGLEGLPNKMCVFKNVSYKNQVGRFDLPGFFEHCHLGFF